MCSLWEVRFTLRKTWLYRKSTMTIVSLDLSDAKVLRSSSREEQMTAYISACFGLHSKLRKQETCNTYLPPKTCPCCSFLPSCPQLLHSWAMSSPVPPLTWVHYTTSPFRLGCRGVVCEQYQLKVRRYSPESALSVSCTGLWLQLQQNLRCTGVGFSLGKSLLELVWNFWTSFFFFFQKHWIVESKIPKTKGPFQEISHLS